MTKRKIVVAVGAGLLLLVAGLYVALIASSYTPEACTYALDLPKVRSLAGSIPGERPTAIHVEDVTGAEVPLAVASAGLGWKKVPFRVYAYQLVFADKTIIVDTAMNAVQAKAIGMTEGYDAAAWERVAKGLTRASAIYVTHEHADHMGGAFADETWAANVHLTSSQMDSEIANRPAISAASRAAAQIITYESYLAVAPGVVIIRAPGHTPGSQMVFVTRADGAEVLLTGDTAWLMQNIEREQGPARLAAVMMKSDRQANACQLVEVNRLRRGEPSLALMPGHDKPQMQALIAKGIFVTRFE